MPIAPFTLRAATLLAAAALAVAGCAAPPVQPERLAIQPGPGASQGQSDTLVRVNLSALAAQLGRRGGRPANGGAARRVQTYGLVQYDLLVTDIRLTATGPGIVTPISTTFTWPGSQMGADRDAESAPAVPTLTEVSLAVPGGANRVFTFEALDGAGNAVATFKTAATVVAGTPVTLTLNSLSHAVARTLEQLRLAPDLREGSPDVADTMGAAAALAGADLIASLTAFIQARTGYDASTNQYGPVNPFYFQARALANLLRARGTGVLTEASPDADLLEQMSGLEAEAAGVAVTLHFVDGQGAPIPGLSPAQIVDFDPSFDGFDAGTGTAQLENVKPGLVGLKMYIPVTPSGATLLPRRFAYVTVKEGEPTQIIDVALAAPAVTLDPNAPGPGAVEMLGNPSGNAVTDGPILTASFFNPNAMVEDPVTGDLYVADQRAIRKVSYNAVAGTYDQVTTVAGSSVSASVDSADAVAPAGIGFRSASKIARGADGLLYVVEGTRIRRIELLGGNMVRSATIIGGANGYVNGSGEASRISESVRLAAFGGALYIADLANRAIRKVTNPAGLCTVSTLAGPEPGEALPFGLAEGVGAQVRMASPASLCFGPDGTLYFLDVDNFRLRKLVEGAGGATVSAVAGSNYAYADGTGSGASLGYDDTMAIAADGTMYVLDDTTNAIRKVTPAGRVTTFTQASDFGLPGVAVTTNIQSVLVAKDGHLVYFQGFQLRRVPLVNVQAAQ